ncbi:MAG TPA: RNA polymerase sigma factor [Parafilimonas sp.]|nr:RNA polymerase sigma factor [Parafilimonas sp.]
MTANDEYLIKLIKTDASAFGTLFDIHYPAVFNYVFHRLADYELCRDITSEVFLKAFLNISSYRFRGIPVLFWLYRIANNEIQQYYRSKKYKPANFSAAINAHDLQLINNASDEEEKKQLEIELQKHDEFILLQQKIKLLPIDYQEVIVLKYFEQKTIKEIAVIKHKKEGTIKSWLSRGVEKLKKIL